MPDMRTKIIERLQAFGPVLQAITSATGAPSVSLGVSFDGQTIYEWNSGRKTLKQDLAPNLNTVYGIGSLSKIFTASAIGILVDEGRLSWQTPVRDILPEFHSRSQFITEELTVEDLLSHRSGMANSNEWWYGAGGELLINKNQTMSFINGLQPASSLRSRYSYSNWNFAALGEVIERLVGMSYGSFINEKILVPLNMSRTSASHANVDDDNLAVPHAILDDLSAYELPMPKCEDATIMAAAQGIHSTVNDLLKYAHALIGTYHSQLQATDANPRSSPLRGVVKQFSAHTSRGSSSLLQKAYCLGMHRHQLPNQLDGLGCNTMFVKKMPLLTPGGDVRLLLSHGGSLAGYTTFLSLLPEINCAIVVLVNSIGLGDPAGWINQLVVETIIDSPTPNDYVALAKEAAHNHCTSFAQLSEQLEGKRGTEPCSKPLKQYIGRYRSPDQDFFIDVGFRDRDQSKLQIAFQGLDSQLWSLDHYQGDTFLCFNTSFNDLARRAIFTFLDEDYFQFKFGSNEADDVDKLFWAHDGSLPADEQFFVKVTLDPQYQAQRPILKTA